jgi:predicted metal-dependent hydrolase
MDYKLVRSTKRKTIGLQVKQGQVTVRAPYYLSKDAITEIVQKKSLWLKAKVAQQQEKMSAQCVEPTIDLFIEGCFIWIRGERKKLQITFSHSSTTYIKDEDIVVVLSGRSQRRILNNKQLKTQVKKQLEQYFIAQAQLYIPARLKVLSDVVDLFPVSYKIRQYKARWGSCNSRQELSFNYLLMMSPDWVVDYVIIHELCHLKHLNHSADFWLLVQRFDPEFKLAKRWLHDRQIELQWC